MAGFAPGIGEIVAVPAALLAIALGMIGVRRYETGRAGNVAPAAAGVALGAIALVVTAVVFIATHVSP